MLQRVLAFIRLGRPLFLGGGFVLYALGAAIAAAHGATIDVRRYALGQLAVTCLQLMTHYANEYFDLEADRANATPTRWSGGSRVLVGGELEPRVALIAALVLAASGGVLAAVLGSATLVVIGVLAWCYSAPPLRLCARGLGELDTAIVVTVLVPWLACSLQGGTDVAAVVRAVVPLALLQFAMLIAIEFPDAAGDAATGKRTLVVILGARAATWLYVAATLGAYALVLLLPWRVAAFAAIPLPVAIWRVARVADAHDASAYERMTFFAVFLLVATSGCELAAFIAAAA
jgi:1,4-dihydroxy-2-naphthoate octaprenyltransferase